jgi:signal peptidase II
MRRAWPWFALAAVVALADQATKWWIQTALAFGERVSVLPFFDLILLYNKGAAFSMFASAPGWQRPMFIGIATIAVAVVSWMLVREPQKRLLCTGLALILGGALGNVWDRIAYGHVVDFLLFHVAGWHWPAFNVADSAITVGAGVVIVDGFIHKEAADAK